MATTKFNAQNIWAGVKKFSSKSLNFCKNAYVALMWIFITVIRVVFLYNPIAFPIVMLFGHRKKAAKVLLGEKKTVVDEMWDVFPMFFCRWEVFWLPWFIRKDFVRLYPQKFPHQDQVKLAMHLFSDDLENFITEMDREAVELLWGRSISRCNSVIARVQPRLNVKTINYLLTTGEVGVIKSFISKNTPSTECIQEVINNAKYFDKRYVAEVLRYTALKHGLSAAIIEIVFSKCDPEIVKVVERALIERNQWLMVNKLKDYCPLNEELWKQFCELNPEIWEGAQKSMHFWMLKEYYASSHKLSESAIVYFLSTEDTHRDDIAKIIFENEEKLSDKVMSVVRSIPDVYSIYLQTRKG